MVIEPLFLMQLMMVIAEAPTIVYEKSPLPMEQLIPLLQANRYDSEEEPHIFDIEGEISVEQLHTLIGLPYEVCIMMVDGKLRLITGTPTESSLPEDIREQRHLATFSLHTHPTDEDRIVSNSPSFGDAEGAIDAQRVNSDMPLLVIHDDGITQYRRPIINPANGQEWHGEARDLTFIWGLHQEPPIDIHGWKLSPYMTTQFPALERAIRYHEMSVTERIALQRRFAQETGMIISDTSWDNIEGMQRVTQLINGTP